MARKISGKLLTLDIQRGASYEELLERYEVTPQAMDRFFKGLVDAGRVNASALPIPEEFTRGTLRTCPKCAAPLGVDSEECTSCGVLVSKFLKRRQREEEEKKKEAERKVEAAPQGKPENSQSKPKSSHGSLIIGLLLGFLGLVIVFVVSNPVKTSSVPMDSSPGHHSVQSVQLTEAIPVRAEVLAEWYQANEVKSDENYKGRTLVVTGVVGTVGKDITSSPYVSLKGNDRTLFGVKCSFAKSNASDLVSLIPGQRVTIQGVCLGKMGTVMLAGCELMR